MSLEFQREQFPKCPYSSSVIHFLTTCVSLRKSWLHSVHLDRGLLFLLTLAFGIEHPGAEVRTAAVMTTAVVPPVPGRVDANAAATASPSPWTCTSGDVVPEDWMAAISATAPVGWVIIVAGAHVPPGCTTAAGEEGWMAATAVAAPVRQVIAGAVSHVPRDGTGRPAWHTVRGH